MAVYREATSSELATRSTLSRSMNGVSDAEYVAQVANLRARIVGDESVWSVSKPPKTSEQLERSFVLST